MVSIGVNAIQIQIQLEELSDYLEAMQQGLTRKQNELDAYFEDHTRDMTEREQEELADTLAEDQWMLSSVLPGHLYSSYILASYSFVERELFRLCERLQVNRVIALSQKDLRGQGVQRSRLYLEKVIGVPLVTEDWSELDNLAIIRNALTHNGGVIKLTSQSLADYLASHGLVAEEDNHRVKPNLTFCNGLVPFARRFFQNVFFDVGWSVSRTSFAGRR